MKILVDAFGGDNSPEEIIYGAIDAINEQKGFDVVLVGVEDKIKTILNGLKFDQNRVSVLPASEVITCEEEPTVAIRKKPDSSICVAFKELKENSEASAFVSAGSTGAVLVGATLKLGRIKGVNRPALCPYFQTAVKGKNVLLLDSGANADCKPINLGQFALMGSIFAETLGVKNPKVALLSNGTEDEKGNALNHEVFPILKKMKDVNFVGNCEARDILSGKYDVVVTDGFNGNIALKSMEGAILMVMDALKEEMKASFISKIGALLLKKSGVFTRIKSRIDYRTNGGALFLGVNKPVIKIHGSSDRFSVKYGIFQAVNYVKIGFVEQIKQKIDNVDLSLGTEV